MNMPGIETPQNYPNDSASDENAPRTADVDIDLSALSPEIISKQLWSTQPYLYIPPTGPPQPFRQAAQMHTAPLSHNSALLLRLFDLRPIDSTSVQLVDICTLFHLKSSSSTAAPTLLKFLVVLLSSLTSQYASLSNQPRIPSDLRHNVNSKFGIAVPVLTKIHDILAAISTPSTKKQAMNLVAAPRKDGQKRQIGIAFARQENFRAAF
ncbi:hypothetical protein DFH09DRAFT_1204364 [Mycena vulgaris]|nr:hypothetical protein DFH09DRAFT_1205607 [Mycena vulgaris]KAJ6498211.1 hypothetical protein DFH09DRAFT_1204364 [Mycena vulgaris]